MNVFNSRSGQPPARLPMWMRGVHATGPGPISSGFPQEQWIIYVGTDAGVQVNMPTSFPPTTIEESGFVFVLTNRGTGAATIVGRWNALDIDTAIPIGESRGYAYDADSDIWQRVWSSSTGGGGGSAIPLSQALATNANLSPAWTDGSAIIVTNDGVARTITLPLIAAANVGAVMVVGTRSPAGSPGAITVAASGGQYISVGALTTNRSAVFVACDFGGASYGWLRTI